MRVHRVVVPILMLALAWAAPAAAIRSVTISDPSLVGHLPGPDGLIGTADDVVERAIALRDAGVTHLLGLYFAANDESELLDQMQIFAEDVVPRIG